MERGGLGSCAEVDGLAEASRQSRMISDFFSDMGSGTDTKANGGRRLGTIWNRFQRKETVEKLDRSFSVFL